MLRLTRLFVSATVALSPLAAFAQDTADLGALVQSGRASLLKAALDAGADPNINIDGEPLVIFAARQGSEQMVDALIDAGADIAALGSDGGNLIHAAVSNSDPVRSPRIAAAVLQNAGDETAALLAGRDAEGRSGLVAVILRYDEDDRTTKAMAARLRAEDVLPLLDIPDEDGLTPMAAAMFWQNETGRLPYFRAFLDMGAPLVTPDGTPLADVAREAGAYPSLFELPDTRILPDSLQRGASDKVLTKVQALLAEWGYYDGPIDGDFGPASIKALADYMYGRNLDLKQLGWRSERVEIVAGTLDVPGTPYFTSTYPQPGGCTYIQSSNQRDPSPDPTVLRQVMDTILCQSSAGAGLAFIEFDDSTWELNLTGTGGETDVTTLGWKDAFGRVHRGSRPPDE